MARYPVAVVRVSSGFREPCREPGFPGGQCAPGPHFALDLAGSAGTAVVSPEAGRVVAARVHRDPNRKGDNTVGLGAPWEGYGPGIVVVAGASGRFHLLAHLATVGVAPGQLVAEGQTVGGMATHVGGVGSHVHWEVRDAAVDGGAGTRAQHTEDPGAWVASRTGRLPDSGLSVKSSAAESDDSGLALLALAWLLSEL